MCSPVVGAGDGAEPLLAGRIPDLELDSLSVQFYRPYLKIHTCNKSISQPGLARSSLTYGGNVVTTEVVVCKSHKQRTLPDPRVT